MKIAIFGNIPGAHFLSQLLALYEEVETVYHVGAADIAHSSEKYVKLLPMFKTIEDPNAREYIINIVNNLDADLIIVLTNTFQLWPTFQDAVRRSGIPALLPTKEHAMLEWSKITGKTLLKELDIPTPDYYEITATELIDKFFDIKRPFVLKFDQDWRAGLQTIIVTDDNVQEEFIRFKETGTTRHLSCFGDFKNQTVIVEEYVGHGREFSFHALCNSTGWTYLGASRDYKKRYENDNGHNTTGMGAYRIAEDVDPTINSYVDKIISHFNQKGNPYVGILYLGIMIDNNGVPIVLEINTRPGDPEFTTIADGIEDNVAKLLYNAATGHELSPITFTKDATVSIRLVNKDYNLKSTTSSVQPILIPEAGICISFNENRELLHSVITASARTREEAADKLYRFLKKQKLNDFTYRTDIGYLK